MRPSDDKFMRLALNLALKGQGKTSPNPMVGAVVVKNGKIVGQGYHRRYGLTHAEVNALKDAGNETKGATLYINLEPCCYFGKTPPCTDAIIQAGIKRVVCALPDPNPQVRGKGFRKLIENGIGVDVGTLKDEASKLNEIYLKFVKNKIPFIALTLVQTLNGKLVTLSGDSRNSIPEKTGKILKNLKLPSDAVLTKRGLEFNSKSGKPPEKSWRPRNGPKGLISLLQRAGENNLTSVLVQGGKENFTCLMKNRLVDKIYYLISARISFKGDEPFCDLGISKISHSIYLKNREIVNFGDHILIVGYPVWR
ncbi:MAG: bifunctional diaminohydroxyphosphoribosylaminopyrimidine deaminase/5-amino-6-(5-phosphoribosylamino)uracil reductase RibD [Candidatus Zixiibacteriota bacterium]